jgi:hypothetical protein
VIARVALIATLACGCWTGDGAPPPATHATPVARPSRIRGIAPGDHGIVIEGPPGYASKTETVTVELGQAPKVMIELAPASS